MPPMKSERVICVYHVDTERSEQVKKPKRKTLCNIIIIFLLGVYVGIHRNVIKRTAANLKPAMITLLSR